MAIREEWYYFKTGEDIDKAIEQIKQTIDSLSVLQSALRRREYRDQAYEVGILSYYANDILKRLQELREWAIYEDWRIGEALEYIPE